MRTYDSRSVKIVAECKEYELLEAVAIQDTAEWSIPLHSIPLSR